MTKMLRRLRQRRARRTCDPTPISPRAPGRDYVAVAEQLIAAGAKVEPRLAEVAQGPLLDLLG
jgi:hypothetical protein